MTKQCKHCKEIKDTVAFSKNATRVQGLQDWCKACIKQIRDEYAEQFANNLRHTPQKRKCPRCKRTLLSIYFHKDNFRATGLSIYCKTCRRIIEGKKKRYKKSDAVKSRKQRVTERTQVLRHYGGSQPRCACCGERHKDFLVVDHINGGGRKHRQEEKIGSIYKWLIKQQFPEGFRILCANCNHAYGIYGKCPHQKKR